MPFNRILPEEIQTDENILERDTQNVNRTTSSNNVDKKTPIIFSDRLS